METFYDTQFNKKNPKMSSQDCAAWMPIYQVDAEGNFNGENADMSEMYWRHKNAGALKIWSGFKLWPSDGGSAWYASEPVEIEYTFQELGFTEPAGSDAGESTGGDDTDMEGSGASALFTAAATALVASLLM